MFERLLTSEQAILRLNGSPRYVGTITSVGSSSTTLSQDSLTTGSPYLLQTDTACFFAGQTSAGGTVSSANGVFIPAGGNFVVWLRTDQTHIAVLSQSGTANVKVFILE